MTVLATAGGPLRADVVSAEGRPIAVDVQIVALKEGQLTYRTAEGSIVSRPIEQIRYLQVAGWEPFNQAEKHRRAGQIKSALDAYRQSMEKAGDSTNPDGAYDRRLLALCRVVALYDSQGRFDEAVAAYLEVLEAMPACVDSLRPRRVPRNNADMLGRAADLVGRAVARRDRLDVAAGSLEAWRATWPGGGKIPQQPATHPAGAGELVLPMPASRPAQAEQSPAVRTIRNLLERDDFEQAIQEAAAALQLPGTPPPELHYWRGRAYLGLAARSSGDAATANRRRAGLAFMRIVITDPASPLAGECLYRAAEICRDEGQPERAAALATELIQTRPQDAPWAHRARELIASLRTASTAPAR